MGARAEPMLHAWMAELRQKDRTVKEIATITRRNHATVCHHLNNQCTCDGPKYVYVAASWFRCRLCGGGWFDRNGCRHEWELISQGQAD